jgi:hypothetical protein
MEIIEKITFALQSGGKLEVFPTLKDRFLRVKEVEIRFLELAVAAAALLPEPVGPGLDAEVRQAYDAAVHVREAAAGRLRVGPRSASDFTAGEKLAGEHFKELEKQLFQVDAWLRVQAQQVLAIEEWLKERRYREGGPTITPAREEEIRGELTAVKAQLSSIQSESAEIRDALEKDTAANAPLAAALRDEDRVRHDLIQALHEEMGALQKGDAVQDAALRDVAKTVSALVDRSTQGALDGDPLTGTLMDVASRGTTELQGMIDREKQRLDGEVAEVQKAELDGQAFARSDGAAVFRAVKDRLSDVLLEADLGLVDMAWQREQIVSDKLRELGKERSDKLKGLDAMEKATREAAEPAPVPGPGGPAADGGESK